MKFVQIILNLIKLVKIWSVFGTQPNCFEKLVELLEIQPKCLKFVHTTWNMTQLVEIWSIYLRLSNYTKKHPIPRKKRRKIIESSPKSSVFSIHRTFEYAIYRLSTYIFNTHAFWCAWDKTQFHGHRNKVVTKGQRWTGGL